MFAIGAIGGTKPRICRRNSRQRTTSLPAGQAAAVADTAQVVRFEVLVRKRVEQALWYLARTTDGTWCKLFAPICARLIGAHHLIRLSHATVQARNVFTQQTFPKMAQKLVVWARVSRGAGRRAIKHGFRYKLLFKS